VIVYRLLKIGLIALFLLLGVLRSDCFAQDSDTFELQKTIQEFDDGLIQHHKFEFDGKRTIPFIVDLKNHDVADPYPYHGMAIYLGQKRLIRISDSGKIRDLDPNYGEEGQNGEAEDLNGIWIGFKGRFKTVLVKTSSAEISVFDDNIIFEWPAETDDPGLEFIEADLSSDHELIESFSPKKLKYTHLPNWLAVLCRILEWMFVSIQSVTHLGWGLSLVLFTLLIKLLTHPLSKWSKRLQEKVNADKAALEPVFQDIKKKYKGEEAHNRTMAAYKDRGITPYHVLKPLIATMITLPILIAIFNMLGEFHAFRGESFLWVQDLAYPDRIASLPIKLPMIGDGFNLMPILMALVTLMSTWFMTSNTASKAQLRKDKRNLYIMAIAFLILFFPFPAAMVIFWTLYTLFQFFITKISDQVKFG